MAESARKLRQGLIGDAGFKLPLKAKDLRRFARDRNIGVLFLPVGMTMRKKNRSYYNRRSVFLSFSAINLRVNFLLAPDYSRARFLR